MGQDADIHRKVDSARDRKRRKPRIEVHNSAQRSDRSHDSWYTTSPTGYLSCGRCGVRFTTLLPFALSKLRWMSASWPIPALYALLNRSHLFKCCSVTVLNFNDLFPVSSLKFNVGSAGCVYFMLFLLEHWEISEKMNKIINLDIK